MSAATSPGPTPAACSAISAAKSLKSNCPTAATRTAGAIRNTKATAPVFARSIATRKASPSICGIKKAARFYTSFWQRRIFSWKTFARRPEANSASTTTSWRSSIRNLIHCSISGYGQSGPYRDKPGFDTIGQALSGMMSLVTDLDDPKVAGISFVDHSAGIFASHGIMAALLGAG